MNIFQLTPYCSSCHATKGMLRDNVESTCPTADGDGECAIPSFSFCTDLITKRYRFLQIETLDDATKLSILEEAEESLTEDFPNCTDDSGEGPNYWYLMTEVATHISTAK